MTGDNGGWTLSIRRALSILIRAIEMNEDRRLTYKQRYRFEDLPQAMRVGELSADLRREVWDAMLQFIEGHIHFPIGSYQKSFYRRVLGEYNKLPIDEINIDDNYALGNIKKIIIDEPAENALQFIEILIDDEFIREILYNLVKLFEKHNAPYRLDLSERPFRVFQHTSKEEADATVASIQAIKNAGGFDGALTHLRNAAEFINERKFADSIRHSISAVESVVRLIEPDAKTLGPALSKLEKSGIIKHPALKESLNKLYGYTNDEQGIRHALLDQNEANVGLPDALFFYSTCAAFAGYLVTIGKVR